MDTEPTDLESLLAAIKAGRYSDQEMPELPTFGGEEPSDTLGVFSWDPNRLLIQRPHGLVIISRYDDWEPSPGD